MPGHTDSVNAVKFFPTTSGQPPIVLSGSADKTIRIWSIGTVAHTDPRLLHVLEGHASSVNCLAVFKGADIIVSGSADATVKIWRVAVDDKSFCTELLQTISIRPRFFPLALVLHRLGTSEDFLLAVAGTKSIVQVYSSSANGDFGLQATLPGHEGWIRSLAITQETTLPHSDLILASASQDKYIRLWRITESTTKPSSNKEDLLQSFEQALSNKAYELEVSQTTYLLTFEALLLGHEDWIYTISWRLSDKGLQLLSASADNSVAIWESEQSSGVWVCTSRLGEIGAQKGSTTATGSTGGFWIGLWSPSGESLLALGRTGSWRLWNYDAEQDRWLQGAGISGHTKPVADLAWSKDGTYLLSTSSDQTTRLHAEWRCGKKRWWHEMSRPQIHGYDLNCIDSIGQTQFVSGADEKLLRVFDEPQATAYLLQGLCKIKPEAKQGLPDTANIPMLGLSNKAVERNETDGADVDGRADEDLALGFDAEIAGKVDQVGHPPFEDQLARYTLWPEKEKLYGHGYEISAVSASHDGSMIATSCKASSIDHAVIRLYTTKEWHEVRPALKVHSLTVTALSFSKDDQYLLSVGRDRQWALFEKDSAQSEIYSLKHSNPKGHTRMILDACWAPLEAGTIFATAGRDKSIKVWKMASGDVKCTLAITASSPVTSLDIAPHLVKGHLIIAMGTETGELVLYMVDISIWAIKEKNFPNDL